MMQLIRLALLGIIFVFAAVIITLAFSHLVLGLPMADIPTFSFVLGSTGLTGGCCALLVLKPRAWQRVSVRIQLIGTCLAGSLLLLALVLAGSQAMFLSGHDLVVVLTMLLFGALFAVGFSLVYAGPLTARIQRVSSGATQLATGDLDTVLHVDGTDEVAQLAQNFNHMATTLKQTARNEAAAIQARRELIAAVSHDLRTPLSAVQALVEAVADGIAGDKETEARYLQSARNEITHLSNLVDELFELARLDAGIIQLRLEPGSIRDLISDILASFQPQALHFGVQLVGEVSSVVDPVLMNAEKLQRVLENLIANALRHTPTNGTILVRAVPQGKEVIVEVTDTGEGIAPQDLPHVFDRSFRGERSRTRDGADYTLGAGLGLTIARGLIEAHGSTIQVQSEMGVGTQFRFTLKHA